MPTFNDQIAQILAGVGANTPQQFVAQAPNVQMQVPQQQAPLISREQLQGAIAQALAPAQPTADDRSRALMQLGAALMQPTRAGQSAAGQLGNAVTGAMDSIEKARQAQAVQNAQRAQTAMAVQQFDTAQRKQNLDLSMAEYNAQWLPEDKKLEFERNKVAYTNALAQGDQVRAATAKANIDTLFEPQKIAADIRNKDSATASNYAHAKYYSDVIKARAEAANKDKNNPYEYKMTKMDDGTMAVEMSMKDKTDPRTELYILSQPDPLMVERQLRQSGLPKEQWAAERTRLLQPKLTPVGSFKNGALQAPQMAPNPVTEPQPTAQTPIDGDALVSKYGARQSSSGRIQ